MQTMSIIPNKECSSDVLKFVGYSETHILRRINEASWILRRRIVKRSIVKVPTTHLFDEETVAKTNMTHTYGVAISVITDAPGHGC